MKSNKLLYVGLLASIILMVVSQNKVSAKFSWHYPAVNKLVVTEYYSQDMGVLSQGSHRLAADLAYVQLLQYYGNPKNYLPDQEESQEFDEQGHHDHEHHHHLAEDRDPEELQAQGFIRLYELGRRILLLDPFFNGAALEVAGSLAFNLKRTGESLDFLHEAIQMDPEFFRYRIYVGAIVYRAEGKLDKMMALLDEAIEYSDCPPVLENILANLHKKNGNLIRAAEVYVHIIKTGIYEGDRNHAKIQLVELIQQNPKIADYVRPLVEG